MTAVLPSTRLADDTLTLIREKVLRGFSAEFYVLDRRWDGEIEVVTKAKLVGVGLVDKPAFPSSEIESVREEPVLTELDRRWLLV